MPRPLVTVCDKIAVCAVSRFCHLEFNQVAWFERFSTFVFVLFVLFVSVVVIDTYPNAGPACSFIQENNESWVPERCWNFVVRSRNLSEIT